MKSQITQLTKQRLHNHKLVFTSHVIAQLKLSRYSHLYKCGRFITHLFKKKKHIFFFRLTTFISYYLFVISFSIPNWIPMVDLGHTSENQGLMEVKIEAKDFVTLVQNSMTSYRDNFPLFVR